MVEFILSVLFAATVVGGLLVLGYCVARADEQEELQLERDELAREWRSLEAERRINGLYMDARERLAETEDEVSRRRPDVLDAEVLDESKRRPGDV